jgi:mRNA interferase RelE/StbE
MNWRIVLSDKSPKQLDKMGRKEAQIIEAFLFKRLQSMENPRSIGAALTGVYAGRWKYRVGDYRIIAKIEDQTITILVVAIGHRSDVYR